MHSEYCVSRYSKNLVTEYFSKYSASLSTRYRLRGGFISWKETLLFPASISLIIFGRRSGSARGKARVIPYIAGAEARRIEKALARRVRLSEDETESRVLGKRSAAPRAPLFEVPKRSGRETLRMHRNEGSTPPANKLFPAQKINLEASSCTILLENLDRHARGLNCKLIDRRVIIDIENNCLHTRL